MRVSPRGLAPRRLVMLASVAGLGLAVLVGAPGPYRMNPAAWTSVAQAADAAPQMPSFADLVAKVKPAVISVRVKFDEASITPSANESGDNAVPFKQGSPFDRFFRQFGFQNIAEQRAAGAAERHGRRVGLLHLGRRLCGDQQPCRRQCQDRPGHHR